MAIILADRYPGRAGGKTLNYPQGSFKNRTSPTAKDGTYLEQDWANDMLAFFQSLIKDSGLVPNGVVDTVQASQYFDALMLAIGNRFAPLMTFAEVDALVADQGPIIVTDMGCMPWIWTETAYFTGYRNPLCGDIPRTFAPTPRAWEASVIGGVWNINDPKQKRLIALFRERGHVVTAGAWAKGWGRIADLGGGDWKAPDLQDVFLRMAGTDADTANPAGVGYWQADALQGFDPVASIAFSTNGGSRGNATGLPYYNGGGGAVPSRPDWDATSATTDSNTLARGYVVSDGVHGDPRLSSETRGAASRVLPCVLI